MAKATSHLIGKFSVYDVIIRGGQIVDGTNSSMWTGDLAISEDSIVALEAKIAGSAVSEIDARNLVIAPGFIDMHSHSDLVLPDYPHAENMVRQGITTEVVGQCGFSPAPISDRFLTDFYNLVGFFRQSDTPWPWRSFGDYLDFMEDRHPHVNVVPLVGHGSVRIVSLGFADRAPNVEELEVMKRELEAAFDAGAWGFSTGLVYPPGCFAQTDELIALASVAASRGRLYFSHIRGEGETLLEAVTEAITVGECASVATQISHFKASGRENWHKLSAAIKLIEEARHRGLELTADVMTTLMSGSTMTLLLPDWVKDGGPNALKARLREPAARAQVRKDVEEGRPGWSNAIRAVGYEHIHVFAAPSHPDFQGKSVAALAGQLNKDPLDVILDCVADDGIDVFTVFTTMSEPNVVRAISHPACMLGSDGWAHPFEGPKAGLPHPRSFGTYPKMLGEFVRDKKVIALEEAVYKMTGMVAQKLGLFDRGVLRAGSKADVVIFDPKRIRDMTTLSQPTNSPQGICHVIVNGVSTISPDGLSIGKAGRLLRRKSH